MSRNLGRVRCHRSGHVDCSGTANRVFQYRGSPVFASILFLHASKRGSHVARHGHGESVFPLWCRCTSVHGWDQIAKVAINTMLFTCKNEVQVDLGEVTRLSRTRRFDPAVGTTACCLREAFALENTMCFEARKASRADVSTDREQALSSAIDNPTNRTRLMC